MADRLKSLRQLVCSTLHRAVVTRVEIDALDGVSIDRALLATTGLFEHERVELTNLTSGARLSLPVRASEVSREVAVTGPAAHLVKPGELVSLSSTSWMPKKQAKKWVPRMVRVDEQNQLVEVLPPPPEEPEEPEER